jgi:phosphatidate cytidylyltransferase
MFRTKLIVALVLAPPFIWIWYAGFPYFHGLMAVFCVIASDEVAVMAGGKGNWQTRLSAIVGSLLLYLPIAFSHQVPFSQSEGLFMAILVVLLSHLFAPGDMTTVASRAAAALLGAVYGGVPIAYLLATRDLPGVGAGLSFMALSLSWFCDTFAYFGGRAFGRTKLYPKMSPNKTIEGLATGALAAGIAAFVVVQVANIPWSPALAISTGIVAAVWGQIGDLCESMLKRSYGVKDSGSFLPGHGGVLDRFDAVLFVAPLIYYVHRYFG